VITLLDHLNIDRAAVLHRISMGGLTGLASDRLPERFYGWPLRPTPWRALAIRPAAVAGAGGTPGRNGGGGRRAADRWFTQAFRQKAPEVVEALSSTDPYRR
jgi:3-oxoadipate enol-lactonase